MGHVRNTKKRFSVLLLLTIALFVKVKSEKLRISCNTNSLLNQEKHGDICTKKLTEKQSHYISSRGFCKNLNCGNEHDFKLKEN